MQKFGMTTEFFISSHGDFISKLYITIKPRTIKEENIDRCNILHMWLEKKYHTSLTKNNLLSLKILHYMLGDDMSIYMSEFIEKLIMNYLDVELIDEKIKHYLVDKIRKSPKIDKKDVWKSSTQFYNTRKWIPKLFS